MSKAAPTPTKMLISLPSDWKAAFEARAALDGLSLSEWACDVLRLQLPYAQQQRLSQRRKRGRPPVEK